jgi:hypothetical protein
MARITDYRPNSVGLRPLLMSEELADLCVERAEMGANFARVRTREDTGEHARSIHVERITGAGLKKDRVGAEIVADAPHSASVEFGNKKQDGDHALRSAIDVVERG